MATTANHPDGGGKFMGGAPAEPDEDIAAIAKQISDHAEVIYQTWKARGLAPNEILTCHNNLNAADKFGSVFTSAFSPAASPPPLTATSSSSSSSSSSMSPASNGRNSPSPPPDAADSVYGGDGGSRDDSATSVNAANLEQFVNEFVVEDRARLAARQKHDGPSPTAAKNYPSSIQYALQKFERRSVPSALPSPSDYGVAKCASNARLRTCRPSSCASPSATTPTDSQLAKRKSSVSPVKTLEGAESGATRVAGGVTRSIGTPNADNANVDGSSGGSSSSSSSSSYANSTSTWPLKAKSLSEVTAAVTNGEAGIGPDERLEYAQKCQTLPSKLERRLSADQYLDEVAKEEERLINALKTGMVIMANDSKTTSPSSPTTKSTTATSVSSKSIRESDAEALAKCESPTTVSSTCSAKTRSCRMHFSNENMENSRRIESSADVVCGLTPKRNRRPTTGDAAGPLEPGSSLQRSNWRVNSGGMNAVGIQSANPVRPFLTRGSVAERVMMFEKCPTEILEKRTKSLNANSAPWKNLASDVHTKIQNYSKEANQRKAVHPPHTTLQRHTKANKNVFIPRFYYPLGKPIGQHQQSIIFKSIEEAFQSLPNSQVTKEQFSSITKACCCPLYWKAPLFLACGGEKLGFVEMNTFLEYWRDLSSVCHDDASRFLRIVTRGTKRSHIIPEDLIPLVQDVVNTHPGLAFLKQAPEFHSRYVHTVICRVYYCVNNSWNGQISLTELRKSDFLRAIQLLEEEEDINQVTAYFSYEHFYVIYCKFWELDRDHDLFISKDDLARHSDHALSTRIIDRIFSRTRSKSRSSMLQEGKMSYTDFVIFLLAEEDKRHPRAIEYWFRCMDLDGDGFLSMYELEFFYDEQLQRMEAMGIECLPFEDCLCQMLDMIQPRIPGKISLSDLKRCKMTPIFFDTFFNLEKYLDHEQRDPFASQRDHDNDMSDWDRYAAEEYELLVAEESGNDHCDDVGQYRITENVEEDDTFSSNLDDVLSLSAPREYINHNSFDNKRNNNYLAENFSQPRTTVSDYGGKACQSDSSDDYAGDSDDCSL